MFAHIALPITLPALTYKIPEGLALKVGDPVKVKLRKKLMSGTVVKLFTELPEPAKYEIKAIEGTCDEFPVIAKDTLRVLEWAADYYHYPIGEVLRTFLPPDPSPRKRSVFRLTEKARERLKAGETLKGKKQREVLDFIGNQEGVALSPEQRDAAKRLVLAGWLEKYSVADDTIPDAAPITSQAPTLTDHQAKAMGEIGNAIEAKKFECFLLEGVTGSGKTEVYLHAAELALQKGQSVLVVVPEISLTPQLVARFRARLGERIALLHSGISDGERSRAWHLLNKGAYRICIGARSASLAPIKNLGLVIVDEEHDSALKQEDHLRYSGRDIAVVRAKFSGCPVILGSATPSLETFHNASVGRYKHLLLPERTRGQQMPAVEVIDQSKYSTEETITPPLKLAIRQTIDSGGQVMLLLNRRGFSSFLLCKSCGFVPECPNCSVSLTNYKNSSLLKCHYCGHSEEVPESCSKCNHPELMPGTLGTESLEEDVQRLFPDAKILRIDRESMERKGMLEKALASIANKEVQIVIGTQIIAKGHDFPDIALVGVVNADSSFHLPDFRAAEKSFQLFTQMAGRAGRGSRPGRVFLQTFNPNHPSIVHATSHDFRSFAEEELRQRHLFQYPPFARLARLIISSTSASLAESSATRLASLLERGGAKLELEILGPAPAVLAKVQNRYRWSILIKSRQAGTLHALLKSVLGPAVAKLDRRAGVQVDVDPVSLM
ncbi:MAG: replication restart helicase PriA [Bdellovibrionota bacterium]